jgi:hypothetical protein
MWAEEEEEEERHKGSLTPHHQKTIGSRYHVVPRKLFSKNFLDDTILATTLDGNFLRMSKPPCGAPTVNGAEVNAKKFDQVPWARGLEPILRLLNLQLQRQSYSWLESYYISVK